jgi:uncharacterized membrane protein
MKKGKDPFEKFRPHEIHLIDPLEKQMRRIEYESSDPLRLIADTHAPEYFSTNELQRLSMRVESELRIFQQWRWRVITLGIATILSFAFVIYFGFLKMVIMAVFAAVLCAVNAAFFYMALNNMRRRFETKEDIETVSKIIDDEIKKRKYARF